MQILYLNPCFYFCLKGMQTDEEIVILLFHIKPYFNFTTPRLFFHKYLVLYDRYFKYKLNEYLIETFEWRINM